jgi:hypothetical protein
MNEDIIRWARESGIPIEVDWAGRASTLVVKDGGTYLRGVDDLERFAALVAAAEREACAKVVEHYRSDWDMADTIRARGQA